MIRFLSDDVWTCETSHYVSSPLIDSCFFLRTPATQNLMVLLIVCSSKSLRVNFLRIPACWIPQTIRKTIRFFSRQISNKKVTFYFYSPLLKENWRAEQTWSEKNLIMFPAFCWVPLLFWWKGSSYQSFYPGTVTYVQNILYKDIRIRDMKLMTYSWQTWSNKSYSTYLKM